MAKIRPGAYQKHERSQISFENSPSLAKQSMAKECDINNIISKFAKTGILDHLNENNKTYGDFLNMPDYHTAQNQVLLAQQMFNELPAEIRSRFNNDPATFLNFAQDEENHPEMVKMGLLEHPAQQTEEETLPSETPPEETSEEA